MPNCKLSDPALNTCLAALAQTRHRQLMLIRGDSGWCNQAAQRIRATFDSCCWLAKDENNSKAIWPQHTHQILGQEFDVAVYDGFSGIYPDKLAALSGTVKAGGLLLLLLPEDMTHWIDPGIENSLSYGVPAPEFSPFLRWLERTLGNLELLRLSQQDGLTLPDLAPARHIEDKRLQQQDAVDAIVKAATGRAWRPLLISADRGRGKSAALGIAAARLPGKQIIFCSAQRAALNSAFKHLSEETENSLEPNHVCYYPPDRLLNEQPECDLLLVDEAASLPVPILKQLVSRFPRTVFASTLIGYEGNGRGYTLRFKGFLQQAYTNFKELHLSEPIRFAGGDPLEQHINSLLALDCELGELSEQTSAPEPERIPVSLLQKDNRLLKQVFALLVLSHYKTSVNDFRHLLDAPNQELFITRHGDQVLAACLVAYEGGIDSAMAKAVMAGSRRPQGHLLAQGLALESGDANLLLKRSARIVRIAVHPELQGKTFGSRLIRYAEKYLLSLGDITLMTTSFGAQAKLMRFWSAQGLAPVKLGYTRDKVSGEHSAFYIKPLQTPETAYQQRFCRDLPLALMHSFSHLDPNVVTELLAGHPESALFKHDNACVQRFLDGAMQFDQSYPALWRAIWARPKKLSELSQTAKVALVMSLIQNRTSQDVESALKLKGKKEFDRIIRQSLHEWQLRG